MGRNISQVSENEKVDISSESSEKGLSVHLLTIKWQGRPAFNVKIALNQIWAVLIRRPFDTMHMYSLASASFLRYSICFGSVPCKVHNHQNKLKDVTLNERWIIKINV